MNIKRSNFLRQTLIDAAKECYELYGNELDVKFKTEDDPVTNIDIAINVFLRNAILNEFPEDSWCSEEDAIHNGRSLFTWIVDPIDGTRSMVERVPEFSISVALMYEEQIVAGGVINPVTKESWFVDHDSIVQDLMGNALKEDSSPADILVSHSQTDYNLDHLKGMGSIALRMCKTVSGEGIAAISLRDVHSWDIAAAYIIAKRANMKVTDINGLQIEFKDLSAKINGVVVSSKNNHKDIMKKIGQRRI
jgi:myo-inositol-1(or 4)-monophosphatase